MAMSLITQGSDCIDLQVLEAHCTLTLEVTGQPAVSGMRPAPLRLLRRRCPCWPTPKTNLPSLPLPGELTGTVSGEPERRTARRSGNRKTYSSCSVRSQVHSQTQSKRGSGLVIGVHRTSGHWTVEGRPGIAGLATPPPAIGLLSMESPMVAALALGAAPMANPGPQIAEAFFEQPSHGVPIFPLQASHR